MPPRYSYWTIIADGLPTAFRAAEREELLPTFARIRDKHPDAQMKWFARGKLWDSPESARRDAEEKRRADARPLTKRGLDWRPGGKHRDPRQPYKDAKKLRNSANRKRKFERRRNWDSASGLPESAHRPREPRASRGFEKKLFARNQRRSDPHHPLPDELRREPRPREGTEPTPTPTPPPTPPHPSEPVIQPPGPPERGRRPAHPQRRRR
jgi:hypothetical protein